MKKGITSAVLAYLIFISFFTVICAVIGIYFQDSHNAGAYCGTFVARGDPYIVKNPRESIRLIDGNWFCVEYVKECKYNSCKVVDTIVREQVPKDYLKWKREAN